MIECHRKSTPLLRLTFYCYATPMQVHDSLANGEADSKSGNFFGGGRSIKRIKQKLYIIVSDTDSLIDNAYNTVFFICADE